MDAYYNRHYYDDVRGTSEVKTKSYQNDMVTFKNKDDVLTALIHLGYLAYDRREQMAYIPNEEIRSEFTDAVKEHQCIIEKYEK